jgi:hypothetical protein
MDRKTYYPLMQALSEGIDNTPLTAEQLSQAEDAYLVLANLLAPQSKVLVFQRPNTV